MNCNVKIQLCKPNWIESIDTSTTKLILVVSCASLTEYMERTKIDGEEIPSYKYKMQSGAPGSTSISNPNTL